MNMSGAFSRSGSGLHSPSAASESGRSGRRLSSSALSTSDGNPLGGEVGDLLRMVNSHRALLRALRIPSYLRPGGSHAGAASHSAGSSSAAGQGQAESNTNLFAELVRFIKSLHGAQEEGQQVLSAHYVEMNKVRAEAEAQRMAMEAMRAETGRLFGAARSLRRTLETKASAPTPGGGGGGGGGGHYDDDDEDDDDEDSDDDDAIGGGAPGASNGLAWGAWAQAGVDQMVSLFDADGDGELAAAEMNALQAALGSDAAHSPADIVQLCFAVDQQPGAAAGGLTRRALHALYRRWGAAQLAADLRTLGIEVGPTTVVAPLVALSLCREGVAEARRELERAAQVRVSYQVDLEREAENARALSAALDSAEARAQDDEAQIESLAHETRALRAELGAATARARAAEGAQARMGGELANAQQGLVSMNELLQRKLAQKEFLQRALWQAEQSHSALMGSVREGQEDLWRAKLAQREAAKDNRLLHMSAMSSSKKGGGRGGVTSTSFRT